MTQLGTEQLTRTRTWRDLDPRPGILLESVELRRTGPADRLDGVDGRARECLDVEIARLGARPRGGLWLVDALEESGLTGRGGAHFSAARKWRAALGSSLRTTVVANAAESEPLSAKDITLLRQRPHLVLDGLACAAETVGATRSVVWIHDGDHYTRRVVEEAIHQRRDAGPAEHPVEIVVAPRGYLSGESSAIAHALGGGPALPTYRGTGRERTTTDPVTLVHNVETLARIAMTARECSPAVGPQVECFAAGPRTTVLTVLTPASRNVIEVWTVASLQEAVAYSSWPSERNPSAVLLGGYGGGWSRWSDVASVEVNEPTMRAAGVSLGAGVVAPVTRNTCGIAETAAIVRYLADSSAAQCGPCLFGLPALAESLEALRAGTARRGDVRRLRADMDAVTGRGACHHPDGATRLVASALETFRIDVDQHAKGRPCAYASATTIPVPRAS
jgi:NADH:ubiquinone oxidoreductase subunit F (NADH-binding)